MSKSTHTTGVRRIRRGLILLAAAAAILLGRADARAEANQATCTFLEIKASNDGSGIDAKLRPLAKKLKRPPMSAWNSFKLSGKHDRTLPRMKPVQIQLKRGGRLAALYMQHTKPKGKKDRLSIEITLDTKAGRRAVDTKAVLDSGDYFVLALSSSQDNADLVAFTCTVQ